MASGARDDETTGKACRNCGTTLDGRYCRDCGQDSWLALRPWRELLAEWADAVLGWETRLGRTVRALLLEPGRLTVEYAAGRRAGWVHPLRVYLGANVLALAVFGATSDAILRHFAAELGPDGELFHMGALLLRMSAAFVVLIPLGAATYALAYRDRGRYYAEHLVFVLHFTAYAFTVHAAASLAQYLLVLGGAPDWTVSGARVAAHAAVALHLVLAARRVHGLGWPATLGRVALAALLFAPFGAATAWLMTR